ncbi:MAG: hypothetical protein FJ291_25170 [Planctomycetes bacterium]|nr:hypothetical protein [Planctomycetota bacterium]
MCARTGRQQGGDAMGKRNAVAAGKAPLFPIVGIGASAGGLEAMTQLLRALPESPGMALVWCNTSTRPTRARWPRSSRGPRPCRSSKPSTASPSSRTTSTSSRPTN